MTPRDFVYWIQGLFELSGVEVLDEEQVEVVKEHLALVLTKLTTKEVGPRELVRIIRAVEEDVPSAEPKTTPKVFTGCACHGTAGFSSEEVKKISEAMNYQTRTVNDSLWFDKHSGLPTISC